jgi:uncharacterized Fe-S cluster protein YjdI
MKEITKRYVQNDLTVIWKPGLCIHSGICAKGLPRVFNPRRKPWIEPEHEDAQRIAEQVRACPSGALTLAEKPDDA